MKDSESRMHVMGNSILAVPAFVRAHYPDQYEDWVDSLSPAAREIQKGIILANKLYPLYEAMVEPTSKVCEMFFNGDERGAWQSGKFSADFALKGIYRLFYKIGKPQFIIERASRVFSDYYPEGELRVSESGSNGCVVHIVKFPEPYRVLEYDMAGWMEGTLELLGCQDVTITITQSLAKGDPVTEFVATWA